MKRADTPFWKWILLLFAGCFLFVLAYVLAYAFSLIPSALGKVTGVLLWLQCILSVQAAAGVLALYLLWWKWTEKQEAADLSKYRFIGDSSLGFGIGMLFFILVTGCMALLGGYRVGSVYWNGNVLVDKLFMFLVVAVGEEVLFRGILFRMTADRWGTPVGLLVSALVFGIAHITNDHATVWSSLAIAIEAGILLGAACKWSGTLWLPIGIHWSWNFFQGPVFGFAVSGSDTPSLIVPEIQGSDWLTGGSFGAEASIPAVVLGLALAVVFILLKRRFRPDPARTAGTRG